MSWQAFVIPWQAFVVMRIIASIGTPFIMKNIANLASRTRRMRAMFSICLILSVLFVLVAPTSLVGPLTYDSRIWLVMGTAIASSIATYASWRAVAISLSKTALFTVLDDVFALLLGYLFLHEGDFLTPLVGIGGCLCIGTALAYSAFEARKEAAETNGAESGNSTWHLLAWIGAYSLVWGFVGFLVRSCALGGLPIKTYLLSWYGGAFLGSHLLFLFMGAKEAGPTLTRRGIGLVGLLSAIVVFTMAMAFLAGRTAPIMVTQPIFQAAEMIIPTVVGLWYYKEIEELDRNTKIVFAAAFIGSLILAVSF